MGYTPAKTIKGFITNTVSKQTVYFQYNPNDLETEKEGHWEDTDARNTHPHQDWKGGGNEMIKFPLRYIANGSTDIGAHIEWLRSLTEPVMVNKKLTMPPICLIKIGFGTWQVRVRKVNVKYNRWAPAGKVVDATVTLECAEWKAVPKPPEQSKKAPAASKPKTKETTRPYAYLTQNQTPGATGNFRTDRNM